MSFTDVRLLVLVSPARARSLLTVRAAISLARSGFSPRSWALSLMCSYCRSRLAEDPRGTVHLLARADVLPIFPAPTRAVPPDTAAVWAYVQRQGVPREPDLVRSGRAARGWDGSC